MYSFKQAGSRRSLALGVSVIAIAAFAPSAFAQCTPDPTIAGETTTCVGLDTDGLVVGTTGSTVLIDGGAVISNTGGPAVSIALVADQPFLPLTTTINVNGTIVGGGQAGIALASPPPSSNPYSVQTNARITVGADRSISGSNGITIANGDGSSAYVFANLDNSGSITGNAGPALLTTASFGGFDTIVNRAGGYIGGIAGGVGSLDNAGTIDGGADSAIAYTFPSLVYGAGLANTGLITAHGAASTITNPTPSDVQNSGRITNTGSGSAISVPYFSLVNAADGEISAVGSDTLQASLSMVVTNAGSITNTGGGAAIRAATLRLTNLGLITGDIVAGNADSQPYDGSRIDNSGGTINGNIQFGAGNDELDVRYTGGGLAGVAGSIDGGGGLDTLVLSFAADTTLTGAVPLPTDFEALLLAPGEGATVTLAPGFSSPAPFSLEGSGTVDNEAVLSAAGPVIVPARFDVGPGGFPNFRNGGTIENTAPASGYAVTIGSSNAFGNAGTITSAAADGIDVTAQSFTNSGTITAGGTAANVSLQGLTFDNSGTIRSTGGTALALTSWYPTSSADAVNSGTIDGAQVGVDLAYELTNTGLITSPGAAVILGGSAVLDNRQGGVVDGNITSSQGANATVANAGTINGDVTFSGQNYYYGVNIYRPLPGGVLNGNLTLGNGDVLVADVADSGGTTFRGINGSVIASGSALWFAVRSDTSASYVPPPGFATVGYELFNNAALTLTGTAPSAATLLLAGGGSVDLTADITTAGRDLIRRSTFDVDGDPYPVPRDVAITSHGNLTYNADPDPTAYFGFAIRLNSGDSFTNTGTIAVHDSGLPLYGLSNAAITGGTIINSGTIAIDYGQAVAGATALINSGTITGGSAAVSNVFGVITNSGTLTSTGGAAIDLQYTGLIDNQAGGIITGAIVGGTQVAIRSAGGTVRNAGTINGSVLLNASPYGGPSYTPGVYIADGGTLDGNLVFGSGNDVLVEKGSGYGVTGAIDGGDGTDLIAHERSSSGTVAFGGALPSNFERELVVSLGAGTVTTVTAAGPLMQDITVGGDGQIINRASTSGSVMSSGFYFANLPELSLDHLQSFVNEGDIGQEILLGTETLINRGTVGSASSTGNATISQLASSALSFENSGRISTSSSTKAVQLYGNVLDGAAITNSGTIDGGLTGYLGFNKGANANITFQNSGRISSASPIAAAVSLTYYSSPFYSSGGTRTTTVDVSGTIENTGVGGIAFALSDSFSVSSSLSLTNAGIIRANGGGLTTFDPYGGAAVSFGPSTAIAVAISADVGPASTATISNAAGGRIEATGSLSTAIRSFGPLVLTNAGTITGGAGFTLAADDNAVFGLGTTHFAGAIQTFGDFADRVENSGTITGSIDLGGGNDTIVNSGTIAGDVYLGAGDDTVTLLPGARFVGALDGGDGLDRITLEGTGTGSFAGGTSFEELAVNGGTWTLTSPQAYSGGTTIVAGANLIVSAQAFGGAIADAGTLTLDQTGTGAFGGGVTGPGALTKTGTGNLMLGPQGYTGATNVAAGTLTLTGASASNSYTVAADATLTSTLPAAISGTATPLSVTNAGTINGARGILASGGAATITNTGTIRGDMAEGVQLVGAYDDVISTSGAIAGGNGRAVDMGGGNDTLNVMTGASFAGTVDGGSGDDTVVLGGSGSGSFGNAVNFEHLTVASGTWSSAGNLAFARTMAVTGGRFIGLAGSTLTVPTITVSQGAVFGSAGTVNGNVAVAGTLSPGASPGTMTINGNLALAGTSVSLFEITPTVADKLLVNGAVSIANGATLQLVASGAPTAGKTLDLVVASGGITGSYTNVLRQGPVFGVLIQSADRIRLLGEFLNDPGFSPQVQRSIDSVNSVLESGRASPAFAAALPLLTTSSGASNPAAFARLSPEPYASAAQIAVGNGLTLAATGRGLGFAGWRETPGLFTFGSALGNARSLAPDLDRGTARARTNDYGFLGGIGFGSADWSIGVFGGYLNSRQRLASLGVRTDADGGVVGVHGRWSDGGFGVKATVAYDGGNADTRRSLPDGSTRGRYGLHSWIADLAVSYDKSLGGEWMVTPTLGATTVRWTRQALSETGSSVFALDVARERDRATFVDGTLRFSRDGARAAVRPYLTIGARYQIEGRVPVAFASLDGSDLRFSAVGAPRARVVATASLGADVSLADRLAMFGSLSGEAGDGDALGSAHVGLKLAF